MIGAYNPFSGQILKTHAKGVNVDRSFLAHYRIEAADADAASDTYIEASTVLLVGVKTILEADIDAQPPTPRVLSVKGNAATVAGNVVITGTDFNDAVITETIIAAGVATVSGTKAFKKVTQIVLPGKVAVADEISVGITDAFGIPFKTPYNTVQLILNNAVATTVASGGYSATVLAENFINPTAALAGTAVDVYLIV